VSAALVVLRKELLDILRDRRTLLLGFLLPALLAPTLSVLVPGWTADQREQPSPVAVVGAEWGGDLVYGAQLEKLIRVVAASDPEAALRRGAVQAVIIVPPDFTAQLARGRSRIVVRYNPADQNSLFAKQKVFQAVAKFSLSVVEQRLQQRGLSRAALSPVEVHEEPIPAGGGGLVLSLLLPLLLAVWALTGASHVASDVGAGEKERGTLEALLSAPVARPALVIGKFAATLALALASTFVAGMSQTVVTALAPAAWFDAAARPALRAGAVLLLAACAFAIAAMAAAWLLALSFFARSMREANQYGVPLLLLVMIGGVAASTLEGVLSSLWLAVVPFVNVVVAMRGVLFGRVDPAALALTLAACAAYTGFGLLLAVALLRREAVIFRA